METPYAVTLAPRQDRLTPGEAERSAEIDEERAARERIQRRARRDEIGEMIGATYYHENHAFPLVQYQGQAVSVSRWYPQRNAVVDIFEVEAIGRAEKREIDFKRAVFKKAGLRYAAVCWSTELSAIMPQLGFRG